MSYSRSKAESAIDGFAAFMAWWETTEYQGTACTQSAYAAWRAALQISDGLRRSEKRTQAKGK